MAGRQISLNIRKTLDMIEYLENRHKGGYILSLDYIKCFDKIEINAILGALKYFKYGDNFIRMIEILQRNFQSCVVNNGNVSQWFNVTRSTHQGDPLAAYLFLVCGETMSHVIKQNINIQPIDIYGMAELLSQFADDMQIFDEPSAESIQATADSMDIVHANVGLELNHEKTSIHIIGNCDRVPITQKWRWTKDYPYVLGVDTNPNSTQLFDILKKGEAMLKSWQNRQLTLMG